jgi:hypothetical protein
MMAESACETSPLLGQIYHGSTPPTTSNDNSKSAPLESGLTPDSVEAPGDLERRASVDSSRAAQFQGAPELQKNMRYILPALSIGVGSQKKSSPLSPPKMAIVGFCCD